MSNNNKNYNEHELMQMLSAFRQSRILLTAVELKVFDEIDETAFTAAELANKISADSSALEKLLDALTSIGLLNKNSGKYSNTESTGKFLTKKSPLFLGGSMHMADLWKTWNNLTEVVKTGVPAKRNEINNRGDKWLESFIAAMHARGISRAITVKPLLDLTNVNKVLDVGGGSGVFASTFINDDSNKSAVIFDLPNVVPITKKYLADQNMSDRISTLSGDYLKDDIGSGYDLVFLSAIVHINSYDENKMLIKKCCDALNPNGQVVVMDFIMNEDRTEPEVGAIFAINMLVGTYKGTTYTFNEVKDWMTSAGLKSVELKESGRGNSLVIGKK